MVVIAGIWGGVFFLTHEEHQRAYAEGGRQGSNLARVFEQYIARVIGGADSGLLTLRESYEHDPQNFDLAGQVNHTQLQNNVVTQFGIIGPDGLIKGSSIRPIRSAESVSDREYFRFHANSTTDELYMSVPLIGRTSGRLIFLLTRRLTAPDGSFGGVILAAIDIVQLERFYSSIDIGRGGVISLIGFDGVIRARSGRDPVAKDFVGQSVIRTKVFTLYRQSPTGTYWNFQNSTQQFEGVNRLISYQVVEGFPLLAVIGQAEGDIFRQSKLMANKYYLIALVLTAIVLVAIGIGAAQKRAETQIVYMARHDSLTGIANRTVLLERMEEALALLRRRGDAFTVFMLDLDLFKTINDSLGHPVGDELLKVAAARLSACMREGDTVARLGGDEFAILVAVEGDQREAAIATANRLLEAVAVPCDLDGHHIELGTSIGIALAPEHGAEVDELVKNADLALYKAKSEGRNTYRFFEDAMGTEARARRALQVGLRDALTNEEFELHYHPIVDVRTGEIASVEALVRWRHPQRGMIAPGEFIPLAEETGLISPIGEWVLRKACSDAVGWPSHIKVSVNLSPVQFRMTNPIEIVCGVLTDSGLSPGRLELEITESVLMHGNAENVATLHQLRSMGISIVLDDFGTGYSSLSYLRMFPFDKIKIDRSFVNELSKNTDCASIVSAVAGLGRSLQVATVAEGIETEDQLTLVRAAGCTYAQGFLFGRPCSAAELKFQRFGERQRKGEAA
ncbi:MAG: putative bifunctional diguanylate cyclase/phosphodiesterase [Xanthobacteraceae bacterium]